MPAVGVYDLVAEGRPASLLDKMRLLQGRDAAERAHAAAGDRDDLQRRAWAHEASHNTVHQRRRSNTAEGERTRREARCRRFRRIPLRDIRMRALPLKAGQVLTMPIVDGPDVSTRRWQISGPNQSPDGQRDPAWQIDAHAIGRARQADREPQDDHVAVERRSSAAAEGGGRPGGRQFHADAGTRRRLMSVDRRRSRARKSVPSVVR